MPVPVENFFASTSTRSNSSPDDDSRDVRIFVSRVSSHRVLPSLVSSRPVIDCPRSAPPHSTLECCPTSPFIQLVPVDVAGSRCLIREYFTGAPRAENTLQLVASCLQPGHRRDFSEIFATWPVNFRRWRIFTFTPFYVHPPSPLSLLFLIVLSRFSASVIRAQSYFISQYE